MSDQFHVLLFGVGAFWFYRALRTCLALQRVPFLAPLGATSMRPWISVVLVVREAARDFERTLRDLLAQRDVDHEVIVVDDRAGEDATAVAHSVSTDPEQLRVERIEEVPDGWLPRANAYARGAAQARGKWLCLIDHPLGLQPDTLARCVQHLTSERAEHLTLIPRGNSGALEPLMTSALMDSMPAIAATNKDREALPILSPISLVDREALGRIGGFEAFRMMPFGEMGIAQRLRESGSRLRVAQAPDEVATARPIRAAALLETLERLFAALGFHFVVLVLALTLYAAIWAVAVWGPFADNVWGYWAIGGLVSQIVPAVLIAQIYRGSYVAALLTPWTMPFELMLTGFAIARMRLRRGVVWQGCFFSIEQLRRAIADQQPDE